MIQARPFRRTRLRPAFALASISMLLAAGAASAAPETLIVLAPENETLYVHFDYDRAPEIPPPEGWGSWKAMEQDSFVVDHPGTPEESPHLVYTHAFYAELGGRKGAGTDYIFYYYVKGDEPHYTAEISFRFIRGDTVESWISGNGVHMADDPRVVHYERGLNDSSQTGFMVDRLAGGVHLPHQEKGIIFLGRSPGWIGKSAGTGLAGRAGPGLAPVPGAWVIGSGGAALAVPERATRLLLLDANGRTAWKAAGLIPGDRLQPPPGLRPGPFRCVWLP